MVNGNGNEYPPHFYYTQTSDGKAYTYKPTHRLVAERLIQNKAYFEDSGLKRNPKILILNDWRIKIWPAEKIRQLREKIASLTASGFQIFFPCSYGFETLNEDKVNDFHIILECLFFSERKIINNLTKALSQEKNITISDEQIHLMDERDVNALIIEKYTEEKIIAFDDIRNAQTNTETKKAIIEYLEQGMFEPGFVETIVEINPLFKKVAHLICNQNFSYKIAKKSVISSIGEPELHKSALFYPIREFKLLNLELDKNGLINEGELFPFDAFNQVNYISLVELSNETLKALLDKSDLTNIKHISFNQTHISEELIIQLIDKAINLEGITCKSNAITRNILIKLKDKQIKTLYLKECTDESQNNTLLNYFSNLKELIFVGPSHFVFANQALQPLTQLETLDTSQSTLSLKTSMDLVCAADNLKYLDISNKEESQNENLEPQHISKCLSLVSLTANATSFAEQNYEKMVILSRFLKHIQVRGLSINRCLINKTPIHGIFLDSLETLDLSNREISSKNLTQHIARCAMNKTLKQIILSGCKIEKTKSNNVLQTTSLLKLIINKNASIDATDLERLLKNSNKLRQLNLTDCYIENELEEQLNLYSLQKLEICSATLSDASINKMIDNSSNLISFSARWGNIQNIINYKNPLNELEEAIFDFTKISTTAFSQLFQNCQNLELLSLEHATIDGEMLSIAPHFDKLESLYITNTRMSEKVQQQLLDNTPKLKYLNLGKNYLSINALKNLIKNSKFLETIEFNKENPILFDLNYIHHLKNQPTDKISRLLELSFAKASSLSEAHSLSQQTNAINQNTSLTNLSELIQTHQDEINLDANINDSDGDIQCNLQRHIFSPDGNHPQPSLYRGSIFNTLTINPNPCHVNAAFKISKTGDLNLIDCIGDRQIKFVSGNIKSFCPINTETHSSFYGITQLTLCQNWQPLPSLSANESIRHLALSPATDFEIKYSKRDNLYYIKTDATHNFQTTIKFTLSVKNQNITETPNTLLFHKVYYQSFTCDTLHIEKKQPTGKDYLYAIENQQTGACRHRAVAFKAKLDNQFENRIVINACHAFIETKFNNQWFRLNLGGKAVELNIDNGLNKDQEHEVDFIEDLPAPSQKLIDSAFEIIEEELDEKSLDENLTETLNNPGINILLDIFQNDLETALLQLEQKCNVLQKPYFRINSADDVVCSAHFIKKTGENGQICDGPGGPLHDFLTYHQKNKTSPILLINYANFSANDIVRLNQIIDEIRYADKTKLPTSTTVIGFIDSSAKKAYKGADFYSRFKERKRFNEHTPWQNPIASNNDKMEDDTPNLNSSNIISLFNSMSWDTILLGSWTLENNTLISQPGKLLAAIKKGETDIVLENAPLENPSFRAFIDSARLNYGFLFQGEWIDLPKEINFQFCENNSLAEYTHIVSKGIDDIKDYHILNTETFSQFFSTHVCDNDLKSLTVNNGIIEENQSKKIAIYITSSLSNHQWAELLDKAKENKVEIQLTAANDIKIPKEIPHHIISHTDDDLVHQNHTVIINSNNPIISKKNILEKLNITNQQQTLSIDVTDVEPWQLLQKLDGTFNKNKKAFEFLAEDGALISAIKDKKNIILSGTFSKSLIEALTPLLINRILQQQANGNLFILADNSQCLSWLNPNYVKNENYSELASFSLENEAIQRYQQAFPELESINPWIGLSQLDKSAVSCGDIDLRNSNQKTAYFFNQREQDVINLLKVSPYVFLSGLTGVGKSTFVLETWRQKNPQLYVGLNKIKDWAMQDKSDDGYITLFIDEANLEKLQFSDFEGLYDKPPGILIDNIYYPLTDKHRVIFAGNPVSYGDERHLANFFKNHGQAYLFTPLPPAALFETVFKPLWENSKFDKKTQIELATLCLDIQKEVNEIAGEVLISPRELSTMALFIHQSSIHSNDLVNIAKYHSLLIAKNVTQDKNLQKKYDAQLKALPNFNNKQQNVSINKKFILTKSRQNIVNSLNDFLTLRQTRIDATSSLNHQQRDNLYKGLGGLIIEGEPGIGKSELILNQLKTIGFSEADEKKAAYTNLIFYHIPVSMGYQKKETLLLNAFHEGAIVIIDEINASPMMESLLNCLLTGYTPDGKRPEKPGFMLIGTQNPATMSGRRLASNALQRRLMKHTLSNYNIDEMQIILENLGLNTLDTKALILRYESQKDNAIKAYKTPPCFRDVIQFALKIIETDLVKANTFTTDKTSSLMPASLAANASSFFNKTNQSRDIADDKGEKKRQKKSHADLLNT